MKTRDFSLVGLFLMGTATAFAGTKTEKLK